MIVWKDAAAELANLNGRIADSERKLRKARRERTGLLLAAWFALGVALISALLWVDTGLFFFFGLATLTALGIYAFCLRVRRSAQVNKPIGDLTFEVDQRTAARNRYPEEHR